MTGGASANPYVGLRPFADDESRLFFGRSEQIVELLTRLRASRFLAVVGSSGAGKSSLVRAGLIPKLKAGFLVGAHDRWRVVSLRPGGNPLFQLAVAVAGTDAPDEVEALTGDMRRTGVDALVERLKGSDTEDESNVLLLVDQFEELFRFGAGHSQSRLSGEARDFVSLLLALSHQRDVPVYVTLTMRSDYLGECDQFAGLPEAMNESQIPCAASDTGPAPGSDSGAGTSVRVRR